MSKSHAYFIYGTLMDMDILARVLGEVSARRIPVQERLTSAVLPNYRRGYIVGRDFPGLALEPGSETVGLLLDDVTRIEAMRLNSYEGPHYRLATVEARALSAPETLIKAQTYVIKPGQSLSGDWDLESWQQHFKPTYMIRCFG
jgi:hypothetical protein